MNRIGELTGAGVIKMRHLAFLLTVAIVGVSFSLSVAAESDWKWEKEPSGYRGVPFGAGQKEAIGTIGPKSLTCIDPSRYSSKMEASQRMCMGSLSVGEVSVSDYWIFDSDKLVMVFWQFGNSDYSKLRETFVEKYGTPKKTSTSTVRTKIGVPYQKESLTWEGTKIRIELSSLGSKVDQGDATFADIDFFDKKLKSDADAQKKAKDSF